MNIILMESRVLQAMLMNMINQLFSNWGGGWEDLAWEDLDAYDFPSVAILGKVLAKLQYNHSDSKHVLVLGPSGHVKPDHSVPAQSANTALQSDSSQESVKPKYTCLALRGSASLRQ